MVKIRRTLATATIVAALCSPLAACSASAETSSGRPAAEAQPQGHDKECKAEIKALVPIMVDGTAEGSDDATAKSACKGFTDREVAAFIEDELLAISEDEEAANAAMDSVNDVIDGGGSIWDVTENPGAASGPDEFGMYDAKDDVKLKSCTVRDPFDLGDHTAVADVSIKNPKGAKEPMHFEYEIEVLDGKGDRIETLSGGAEDVRPGQIIDTGTNGDGEEDAIGSKDQLTETKIKCEVISAQKDAASNYS